MAPVIKIIPVPRQNGLGAYENIARLGRAARPFWNAIGKKIAPLVKHKLKNAGIDAIKLGDQLLTQVAEASQAGGEASIKALPAPKRKTKRKRRKNNSVKQLRDSVFYGSGKLCRGGNKRKSKKGKSKKQKGKGKVKENNQFRKLALTTAEPVVSIFDQRKAPPIETI